MDVYCHLIPFSSSTLSATAWGQTACLRLHDELFEPGGMYTSFVLIGGSCPQWEVGRRVNSTFEPEHSLPGFMGTAHGLVTAKGVFRGKS